MGPSSTRFKQELEVRRKFFRPTRGRTFLGFPENLKFKCADVRLAPDFVRFTPESGHYSGLVFRPFLTHNGHSPPRASYPIE